MLASLPMYDLPEVRAATDAWWAAIARALRRAGFDDVPRALSRGGAREVVWRSPELLLTQTCGYPLRFEFDGVLSACAAPVYRAPGCEGPLYSSALVARADDPVRGLEDFRGRVLAANGPDSQSGCNCVRAMVAPLALAAPATGAVTPAGTAAGDGRFFSRVAWSGTHRASLAAVRCAEADVAAIDAVTYALVERHAPDELDGLRVLGWTPRVPALPYAVSARLPAAAAGRVRGALLEAVLDPAAAAARDALLLGDVVAIEDADYEPIVQMRRSADSLGYCELDG